MRFEVLALAIIVFLSATVQAEESQTTAADRTGVGLTIYNDNLAMVRDARRITVPKGRVALDFADVSARIRPETAILDADWLTLLEQNFNFDLLTHDALMRKAVGSAVTLIHTDPESGRETEEQATLLSYADGRPVFDLAGRIETSLVNRRVAFQAVPETLRSRPTLVLDVESARAGARDATLTYLTGGLSWKADYVATLNDAEDAMSVRGLVTLTNNAGVAFADARLQLLAGDVNQVNNATPRRMVAEMAMMARADDAMVQEKLGDHHLYTLGHPTTLLHNQTKQVSLLESPKVAVRKAYMLDSPLNRVGWFGQGEIKGLKPDVRLTFANEAQDGLGVPLPKGVFRVYRADSKGRPQFVGEDWIDHTPKNETVDLKLGQAFDLRADAAITDVARLSGDRRRSSARITLRNATDEDATVLVEQAMGMSDWALDRSSHKAEQRTASLLVWTVTVPANGSETITFTVTYR